MDTIGLSGNWSVCIGVLPTVNGLCKYQVTNKGLVDVSGRRYACTSTEESSRLRASLVPGAGDEAS